MNKKLTINSVMTPFPYNVDIDASIAEADELLKKHNFHHLPVLENGSLAGALSARDITLSLSLQSNFDMELATSVRSVYSPIAYSADIKDSLASVLDKMIELRIGSVIVTKNGRVAGIITHTDIAKALLSVVRSNSISPEVA